MQIILELFIQLLGLFTPYSPPNPTPTPIILNLISTPVPTKKVSPTVNPLLREVNLFRDQHGVAKIISHPILCAIAKERVQELNQLGKLDNHAGFAYYRETLTKNFHQWWETLYFASPPKNTHEVIFSGWANSQGHRDALLSTATNGCGEERQGYAVFILGKK